MPIGYARGITAVSSFGYLNTNGETGFGIAGWFVRLNEAGVHLDALGFFRLKVEG